MASAAHAERRPISFRVPNEVVDLVDRAASSCHQDRTEFVVDAMREKAEQVLKDQTLFELSPDDYSAFVHALDNPPEPTECLKRLMKRKPIWDR